MDKEMNNTLVGEGVNMQKGDGQVDGQGIQAQGAHMGRRREGRDELAEGPGGAQGRGWSWMSCSGRLGVDLLWHFPHLCACLQALCPYMRDT